MKGSLAPLAAALVAAALPVFLVTAVAPLMGCGGSGGPPSTAADAYLARAEDDEEREGLSQARDDIDAEMRSLAEERDAEIERLRKENEALRARVEERRRKP